MNRLTNTTRNLTRTTMLAAFVALLAAATAQRASANQSGDPVGAGTSQALTCEAAGGTARVDVARTVGGGVTIVRVTCIGGVLDGITCDNVLHFGTFCYETRSLPGTPATQPTFESTGEIEVVDAEQLPTLEIETTDEVATPTEADAEPVQDDPEISDDEESTQGTTDETADDGVEDEDATDDGGQDLPGQPERDETADATDGDAVADPSDGAEGEVTASSEIVATWDGTLIFFEEDEQS